MSLSPRTLWTPMLALGCARAPAVDPATRDATTEAARLAFEDVGQPEGVERLRVRWSPRWRLDDREGVPRLALQIAEGQSIDGTPFGIVTTADGQVPFADPDGTVPWTPGTLDHSSLQEVPGGWRLWTHVESGPSSLYLTDLAREGDTFTPTTTRSVDLSGIGGGKDFCAGMITPWGTLLSSEEYDVDRRTLDEDGLVASPTSRYDRMWNRLPEALPAGASFHPWQYGWVPEFAARPDGTTIATKHLAMGRFSHEIALVMPDRRTVLLTDDRTRHGGMFLFVADRPEDLSAGTLYAMRWEQAARADGGAATLSWVSLGHAGPEDLRQAWSGSLGDVMTVLDPLDDGSCPTSPGGAVLRRITTTFGTECVGPVPGRETLASRVETRRFAAWAGATTELTKLEGATFDPMRRRMIVAISRITEGMTDGRGAIDVDPNPCGGLYALEGLANDIRDHSGRPIDSAFIPTRMYSLLTGDPQPDGTCSPDGIAEPDNVTVLPTHDLLVIAEDTSPARHAVPTLWTFDMQTRALTRLATAPRCGEWSGLHGTVDGDDVWLTVSMQHAGSKGSCGLPDGQSLPADEPPTWTGVLGPLPRGRIDPLDRVRDTIDRRITDGIQ